jgi:tetratricopeptide (TPR) repeat protein
MGLFSRHSRGDGRSERARGREAFERGQALFERKRWSEAAQEFARATELLPDSVDSHLLRGVALTNARRVEEALEPLRDCLRLHPEYDEAHNALGMALGKLGRYDEAAVHVVQAARLGHQQAVATMHKLGMDYCRECHRPVYRTPPAQADVHVIAPKVGMRCTACHEVFCVPCLLGDEQSAFNQPCLRCSGELAPMELENS